MSEGAQEPLLTSGEELKGATAPAGAILATVPLYNNIIVPYLYVMMSYYRKFSNLFMLKLNANRVLYEQWAFRMAASVHHISKLQPLQTMYSMADLLV